MAYLRYPGRILAKDEKPHDPVLNLIAEQLQIPTAAWELYADRERTVAGLKAARARGRNGGRPAKLSAKEIKTIRALLKTANIPVAAIAGRFKPPA